MKNSDISKRLTFAIVVAWSGFCLLGIRLWFLQGVYGSYYRDRSENNRIRAVRKEAARGVIYDRNGKVLVRNRPAFNIAALLEDIPDIDSSLDVLSQVSSLSSSDVKKRFKESGGSSRRFEPRVVLRDISHKSLAKIKAHTHELPGMIVTTQPKRLYPHGQLAAQTLGYTREISGKQLKELGRERYRPGDTIGQSGLEKVNESTISGTPGFAQVEVDASGRRRAELGIVDTIPGKDLYLTIDLGIQKVAEKAFEGRSGVAIAMDPRNGEILTLASLPSFDPNIFSSKMSSKIWGAITKDPQKPLRNRAIASRYPPGSTVKLFWGLAGLAEGVIDEKTTFSCPGYYSLNGHRFHCHKRAGHGKVNLKEAIRYSCNVFFYNLGLKLGIDSLSKYMEEFGFGSTTGIELLGEQKGTLPSREWKKKRVGERWYTGDTLPVAIGQGYLSVTPIQMLSMVSALANDGYFYRPHIVSKSVDAVTGEMERSKIILDRKLDIDPAFFETVRLAAKEVVHHERGTGKKARVEGISVGGKTGTAQVVSLKASKGTDKYGDHSIFVGFAPVENPTIAAFVLVEHGGHGGSAAAPIAGEIFKKYFLDKGMILEDPDLELEPKKEEQQEVEQQALELQKLKRARLGLIDEEASR